MIIAKSFFFFIRASSSRLFFNHIRFFVKLLFPSITSLSPTMWRWGNLSLLEVLDFARWPNQSKGFHWKTMKVLSKSIPESMARRCFGLKAISSKISKLTLTKGSLIIYSLCCRECGCVHIHFRCEQVMSDISHRSRVVSFNESFISQVLTTSPRQFWKTTGRVWIRVSYLGHLMIGISLNGKKT